MRRVDNDDDFMASAREALQLATADSEPLLSEARDTPPSQSCPVALRAIIEVMD